MLCGGSSTSIRVVRVAIDYNHDSIEMFDMQNEYVNSTVRVF